MSRIIKKSKKSKNSLQRDELEPLEKSELIDKILRLEASNLQLKALINKSFKGGKTKDKNIQKKKPFDFAKCHKRHILLKFYYLGWNYDGFVVQEDTNNTVEQHLFAALEKSCCIESRETSNYHRCGRTDKGVSSFSQVVSLDVRSKLKLADQHNLQDELPYCKMLNRLLPENIRCTAWCPVPSNFSARFDCKFRTYKYIFPRGNLDINAMNTAVKYTIGSHDFRNICKMDVANGVVNFMRTIIDAKVSLRSTSTSNWSGYDMCELVITSQAFLWHQIRCLMGILLLVGQGKESPEIVPNLLNIAECPRKPQYNLAHELPLNLWYCEYENREWVIDEDELIRTIKTLQSNWTFYAVKSDMIKDMLSEVESLVGKTQDPLLCQTDCLILGVQSKIYKPLMSRETCESLENRIKHYEKKRKLDVIQMSEED